MEPESKRMRLTKEHDPSNGLTMENMQIKSILSDEYTHQVKSTQIYVSAIKDMKVVSTLIEHLTRSLPLSDLQHLKRVRKNQIILCKKDAIESIKDCEVFDNHHRQVVLEYLLKQGLDSNIATDLCADLSVIAVASTQPKLRWQYNEMNQQWPCKFHPNKYLEALFANKNFTEKENSFHLRIALAVRLIATKESSKAAAICVDPRTNSIVATASDQIKINPLLHCPMVLVDMVARSQNGGVWDYTKSTSMPNKDELNFAGISEDHYKILSDNFKDMLFGAEKVDPDRKIINVDCMEQDNLSKYGPYLCTGYDVYLSKEPCLMCAMALVHSRVKRVFYLDANRKGALGSYINLHTVKDLNHHFEVFQIIER